MKNIKRRKTDFTANASGAALRLTSLDNPKSIGGIFLDNLSVTLAAYQQNPAFFLAITTDN